MAGYTDLAFRRVLKKCGAKVTWTEMISVTALYHQNEKTSNMLARDGKTIVQLFGHVPEHFAAVIKSGILDEFEEININMGCPARKIVTNGDGCALMRDDAFSLAKQIIEACVSASKKPISVKFRLGWDKNTGIAFAEMCESAGAARLIVHGRLGVQGYSGVADWKAIAEIVNAVKIPVIANGDIKNPADAQKCMNITNAAGVMIGRALIGAPWNISDKKVNKNQIIKYHIDQSDNILELRKHLLAYIKDREIKKQLIKAATKEELLSVLGL